MPKRKITLYKPSDEIKQQIAEMEGAAMYSSTIDPNSHKWVKKNNSFEDEAIPFSYAIPDNIRDMVLSNQPLADKLFSYSYNVGSNNFKKRVVPALKAYYYGTGHISDILDSMYAHGDKKLEGLANRRTMEKEGVKKALSNRFPTPNINYTIQPDATRVARPTIMPMHRKSEGGSLNTKKQWSDLTLAEKSDIMRDYVAQGVTSLRDIRQMYDDTLEDNIPVENSIMENNTPIPEEPNDNSHSFKDVGYKPSQSIKDRIANWEGSSMKRNRSFEAEAKDFNRVIPASIRNNLNQQQLDALYSYGYNVGMGYLKKRVLPTLREYVNGRADAEDVANNMWATKDSILRGLRRRKNTEKSMFTSAAPYEKRQSVITKALNMDLSSLPSYSDINHPIIQNPYRTTAMATPIVDVPQAEQSEQEEPVIEESRPNIFDTLSKIQSVYSMMGNNEAASSFSPIMAFAPRNNLLSAVWNMNNHADGGYIGNTLIHRYDNGGNKKGATIYRSPDGRLSTASGHPVEALDWDENGYRRYRDTVTGELGHAFEPSEAYTKTLVDTSNLPIKERNWSKLVLSLTLWDLVH